VFVVIDNEGKVQQVNDMKGDLDVEEFKQRIQQEGLTVIESEFVPDMKSIYNFETKIFEPG